VAHHTSHTHIIPTTHAINTQEGDGISPTAIREILLLRELRHEHIVTLTAVHIDRGEPSLSLAFDYAEHDLYEIIWHHRDRLAGACGGARW
jgi:cyclin-dependent kinase 8/11